MDIGYQGGQGSFIEGRKGEYFADQREYEVRPAGWRDKQQGQEDIQQGRVFWR